MTVFGHLLDSPRTTRLACVISLAFGLFFTFVWAPHPWSWEGIDQYHELARALARGEGFGTTDVPWGYAYYVALFYSLFGVHPVLPILGQVLANAAMPLLLFALVRPLAGQRTAALSALIVGIFSFNTVYASTQVSDAICSVLFMAAVLCFARGHAAGRQWYFAGSGLLAGLVPQFRPNLLLLPAMVAVLYVTWTWLVASRQQLGRAAVAMSIFLGISVLALVPWVVHNYRLTGVFLPTSSHGGIQLWYGTLQVGPYLENYSANPRTVFATPVFDYSSLSGQSIVVSAVVADCASAGPAPTLVYWTDRNTTPATITPSAIDGRALEFAIPGQPDPTAVYWRINAAGASAAESLYYIASDHTGDLDRHDDWLDVFDVIRLARHLAWAEPVPAGPLADFDGNGRVERADLSAAVFRLLGYQVPGVPPLGGLVAEPAVATLQFSDGSYLRIPNTFTGRVTDLDVRGGLAGRLLSAKIRTSASPASSPSCGVVDAAGVNDVFYRRELQQLARFGALALDNIGRDPLAFAAASAYRAVRLFVVRPSGDLATTYQFASGRLAYTSGLVLSLLYFGLFLAGVVAAWRQRSALLPLLVPIVYVPATICFVLTNQRYTVTVQPLMFAFVALALVRVLGWDRDGAAAVKAKAA